MKSILKSAFRLFGVEISNISAYKIPFGVNWKQDIRFYVDDDVKLIFDVGANIGQTTQELVKVFHGSEIYCFEPVPKTFKVLTERVKDFDQVKCFQLALGEARKESLITNIPLSGKNALLLGEDSTSSKSTTAVEVETIDNFCERHQIDYIDVLKIDTEGYEVNVLAGAKHMLEEEKIGFIFLECDFGDRIKNQVVHGNFFEIFEYLSLYGYRVVSFYTDGVDRYGWDWGNVLFKSGNLVPRKLSSQKRYSRWHLFKDFCPGQSYLVSRRD